MPDYSAYFPAKLEKIVKAKDVTVGYVEFFDGNKALVTIPDVEVAEGDIVIIGRRVLFVSPTAAPTYLTKDEVIGVLNADNTVIYSEMKESFESNKVKRKEIDARKPSNVE
jgi:hypothetical protein